MPRPTEPVARRRPEPAAVVLAAFAGASAWVSLGALAVTDAGTGARLGALPSPWILAGLVAVCAAAAWASRLTTARAWPLAIPVFVWLPWLPWLPGRVPAAALIFEGPVEPFVWMAALAGLVLAGPVPWPRSIRDIAGRPGRAPVAAAVLAAACYGLGAWSMSGQIPAGDEPHYLIITQSLLRDGDLRIENNHQRGDYFEYFRGGLNPDYLRRGVDGAIYSIHAPGISAVVLPAFALAGYPGALVFVILLAAAGTAFAWHAAWLLTGSAGAAWFGWATVAFAAPVYFHAFTVYPDGTGAALTMVAVWVLARIETSTVPVGRGMLVAAGAALAVLPWLHTRFAIVAAVLGAALALRLLRRSDRARALAAFAALPLVAAAGWFLYFRLIYGTFNPSAPYGGYTQSALAHLLPGLPGLFTDQQFGLFASAPMLVAAVVGLVPLARRHPRLATELVAVAVPYALAVASYRMWWGGYSAPARFLVVLLLPLAVPAAVAWQAGARAARAGMAALVGLGLALVGVRAAVDGGRLVYNGRDGHDLLLDWASRHVNLPLAFPSLHRDPVGDAVLDAVVWVVAAGLASGVLALAASRARRVGPLWTATACIAGVSVMGAATVVWARHADGVVTASSSQADFLRSWNPVTQPLLVGLTPARVIDRRGALERLSLRNTVRGAGTGNQPLLRLPLVPAGRYEVLTSGRSRLSGTLEVMVGRTGQVLERWPLEGRPGGVPGLTLDLPVLVHSVTIRGDAAARATIGELSLRPVEVVPPAGRLDRGYALRATRYGPLRVFFMDDEAFMEPPGFWTWGGAASAVLMEGDGDAPLALLVRNGAVANTVAFAAGAWREVLELAPGEERRLEVPRPASGGPVMV
ncbi:MAG: hypothetical protein AB7N90_07715, partial [Vicinamibacterales bacterium]